ncbi:MAG: ATP-dependent helicase [Verrucomicrobiota bacterium]|jgi:DNA helicase-2/ATP-dependent DNA helicase PcrA
MARDYVLQPFRPPVELQIDYARELNPQQLAAVTALPGPALVLAGAGAGKTRTLTYRVAWLIEQGIPPEAILLLTFTNKAAKEMMGRVASLLGQPFEALWGGTFHAIGHRFLRRHAELLGYRRDFTILDRADAGELLNACLGEAEIDVKATRFPKADVLGEIYSLAVNTDRSVPQVLERQFPYFLQLAGQITELQQRYTDRKRAGGVVDFDDLLVLWLRLLREHDDVGEHYQRRFQFILVDEYQDTNQLQSDLIDLLAARHHNVMAVGDDSQSIYSWRGANFLNILRFADRHPGAKVYKIETNYRSTPEILTLANAAIAPNLKQHPKQLVPMRATGPKPVLVVCPDAGAQAAFVAQRALELREEGLRLADMAVLYRSHFHALELQLELTRRNIPFSITSGIRFFEQAHVKDIAAYLRIAANPRDELAFKRLARMLPGIGPKGADKLWGRFAGVAARSAAPSPAAETSDRPPEAGPLPESDTKDAGTAPARSTLSPQPSTLSPAPVATALQAVADAVPKKAAVAWAQFIATVAQLEAPAARGNPARMIELVVEAVYEEYLQRTFANYAARLEDVGQLAAFARQFAGLEDFLAQLALLTNIEAEADAAAAARDDERLRLSTIHQAKGLEFGVVFVIMLCDGLFPSARSTASPEGEEEERRLFYVAITRAKNELYLSFPLVRTTGASGGDVFQQPSRFLRELPRELLDEWSLQTPAVWQ